MGLVQLVEEVRETKKVGGRQEGDREGRVSDAGRLERPRKDRLRRKYVRVERRSKRAEAHSSVENGVSNSAIGP